ncbi:DNA repair protein RadC [Sporobacter termitidis DSM 10068]|uniref:DNA repair protein RadC n=1 Tax=Sporobacter termitidis DSM 10068 TaxID=1123282 RepID=A0A1M5VNU7_9FIRM|nr:DNA repair protein RadC [Sporobacter termitidis]SHH76919.1 DNA repair protein RadC [Sporobacter termitidis DSM 10068]
MNIHDGHRERMKSRFTEHGLENFDDHSVLELFLFYALPRADVNPLAHALLDKFGTLAAVFDAPADELAKVPGIGQNTALYLKLIPQVSRRYLVSRSRFDDILDSSEKAGAYLLPCFYAERDEVVYMVCLDAKGKVINCKRLFRGSVNSASVSVRKIVENALNYNSTSVILAHNHTSGIALPSEEDGETTRRIESALRAVDVVLADHIVVADDDFVSMADNGFFK